MATQTRPLEGAEQSSPHQGSVGWTEEDDAKQFHFCHRLPREDPKFSSDFLSRHGLVSGRQPEIFNLLLKNNLKWGYFWAWFTDMYYKVIKNYIRI